MTKVIIAKRASNIRFSLRILRLISVFVSREWRWTVINVILSISSRNYADKSHFTPFYEIFDGVVHKFCHKSLDVRTNFIFLQLFNSQPAFLIYINRHLMTNLIVTFLTDCAPLPFSRHQNFTVFPDLHIKSQALDNISMLLLECTLKSIDLTLLISLIKVINWRKTHNNILWSEIFLLWQTDLLGIKEVVLFEKTSVKHLGCLKIKMWWHIIEQIVGKVLEKH